MSWMRSRAQLGQFQRVFLPTLPSNLDYSWAKSSAVGAGGSCLDIFCLSSLFYID